MVEKAIKTVKGQKGGFTAKGAKSFAKKALTVTSYAAGAVVIGAAVVGTGGTAIIIVGGVAVAADVGLAALDCTGKRSRSCGMSLMVVGMDAVSLGAGKYVRSAGSADVR